MTYKQLLRMLVDKPMAQKQFFIYVQNIGGLYSDLQSELALLDGFRAPLCQIKQENEIFYDLNTKYKTCNEATWCFVDIESNGSKPESAGIIEIGAIKMRGGEILDRFESFVYAESVPANITELTGICTSDLQDAPKAKEVLSEFRDFLDDSVFVAHNVDFDYNFIDYHLRHCGLFGLLNPKLCTIDLAKSTILSPRYSLSYLNAFIGLDDFNSHRAYADALASLEIFKIATKLIDFKNLNLQHFLTNTRKHKLFV